MAALLKGGFWVEKKYLCFDIGGTSIKYAVATQSGKLITRSEMPTQAKQFGGPGIVEKLKKTARHCLERTVISGIAISTAGMVDPQTGSIFYALPEAIPDYTGTPLKKIMEEEFSLPCSVENDVNCAALGEMWLGAGRGRKSAFCLTVGTSIGGCAVINGKIWHGANNSAGEIAYMRVPGGRLHDLASAVWLIKKAATAQGVSEETMDGHKVFSLAKEGYYLVKEAIDEMVAHLSDGICNICAILNPEIIILGGGIMAQKEYLQPLISAALKERLVPVVYENTTLAFAELKNDAGLLGALDNLLGGSK